MKFFISCSLLFSLLCLLYLHPIADASVAVDEPHPQRKSGGCYSEETGHLQSGQTITVPGTCSSASCNSDESISLKICALIRTRDPYCHLSKKDLSKPFPECCPRIACAK
ncbi:hypothetical protein Zmor_005059 [Zophobas morio]|uniref:Single domain-containing protein n=1 Tax=Zophobas morio TaxID=2755281 RepID=A0AA38MKB0_9CUCU|nr:hypothetical protein Zmor_005059 [Zophobas morio]